MTDKPNLHVVRGDGEKVKKNGDLKILHGSQRDPDIFSFYINRLVTTFLVVNFRCREWEEISRADYRNLMNRLIRLINGDSRFVKRRYLEEQRLKPLVNSIFAVPGVSEIALSSHTVNIVKGRAFDWEDIVLSVEGAIICHFEKKIE
ncbi:MAG: NifU N-terminal domain-containing protein [Patescibacteria group bacterium]